MIIASLFIMVKPHVQTEKGQNRARVHEEQNN